MKVVLIHVRENKKEIEFERRAFLRTSGLEEDELASFDFLSDGLPENILDCDALVMGGSKFGVAGNDSSLYPKNLDKLVNLARTARDKGIPYMGLCFGGQLLAYVFGGEAVRDSNREERGTFEVMKTPEALGDPLFRDLPEKFMAQCAHHDFITRLPPGAALLAVSALCPVQAFRLGENMYGFQFHPERTRDDYEAVLKWRFQDHAGQSARLVELAPSPEAEKIPRKFVDIFVRAARA